MEESDRSLVAKYLGGDEGAFREIYRRHTPVLFALATRMTGIEDAEDVVQDAWVRAASQVQGFEWRSTLRTWLCGVVLNCARERIRRRGDRVAELPRAISQPFWYDATAAQIDLERALGALSPRYREVVLLHDVLELTHNEIADLLSIDVGTSKSNTTRARAALRELLESDRMRRRRGEPS